MSERRLFSTKVTESDAFLDMPLSSQALYFHICLNCDDDGVCDSPRKIIRMVGAQADDLNILVAKRFLLQLSQNVVVVKHWLIHNTLQKDRYKTTKYGELMSRLFIKWNGAYTDDPDTGDKSWTPKYNKPITEREQIGNRLETNCFQDGNESQVKSSQDKSREVNISQSSVIDLLTDEESELLDDHVTDFMELLDRLDAVDASTVKKPYAYCVKVAKQSGLWK